MQKQGSYSHEHIERLLQVIDSNRDGKVQYYVNRFIAMSTMPLFLSDRLPGVQQPISRAHYVNWIQLCCAADSALPARFERELNTFLLN